MASNPPSHQAANGWLMLSGERVPPQGIELLRRRRDTMVFRLQSSKGPIVAKRCPAANAVVERTIYERLLPKLAQPTLRYYGTAPDTDREFCWLYLEKGQGQHYLPHRSEHRIAAGRWLAALHDAVDGHPDGASLPDRRPSHYRTLLGSVLDMLCDLRTESGTLDAQRRTDLEAAIAHCERLADRWEEIEDACERIPRTLVHGDLVSHNVCVRSEPAGLVFIPFDWEKAGWGSPAEDLSSVDLESYLAASNGSRVRLESAAIERLAGAGKAFRCVVFLHWLGPDLLVDQFDAYERLRQCRSWLDVIMAHSPWTPW